MDDVIAESCGCMTAEWLNEQLADFMYTFENDSDGEFIVKGSFNFYYLIVDVCRIYQSDN